MKFHSTETVIYVQIKLGLQITMLLNFLNIIISLLILHNTKAKKIKLEIETDDLIKLMDGIMKTEMFKNVANQIIQRSVKRNYGLYNPYHPEDKAISNEDFKKTEKETSRKNEQKSRNIYFDNNDNSLIESKIEKENSNYMKTQDDKSAEKQFFYSNSDSKDNNIINETSRKHIRKEKYSDMHNFKKLQKRFKLMKS